MHALADRLAPFLAVVTIAALVLTLPVLGALSDWRRRRRKRR